MNGVDKLLKALIDSYESDKCNGKVNQICGNNYDCELFCDDDFECDPDLENCDGNCSKCHLNPSNSESETNEPDNPKTPTLYDLILEKSEAFNKKFKENEAKNNFILVHDIGEYISKLIYKSIEQSNEDVKLFNETYDENGLIKSINMDFIFRSEDDKEYFDKIDKFFKNGSYGSKSDFDAKYLIDNLTEFLNIKFKREFKFCKNFKVKLDMHVPTSIDGLDMFYSAFQTEPYISNRYWGEMTDTTGFANNEVKIYTPEELKKQKKLYFVSVAIHF